MPNHPKTHKISSLYTNSMKNKLYDKNRPSSHERGYDNSWRVDNPEGFFTEQVVAEFIVVPDEVQDHWFYDEEAETWILEQPQPEPMLQVTRIQNTDSEET